MWTAAGGCYSPAMARGWESKSVEAQQTDPRADRSEALAPEERTRRKKLASLDLSRRRVLQDLATAGSPGRRISLEQALAFLDEEIRKLG